MQRAVKKAKRGLYITKLPAIVCDLDLSSADKRPFTCAEETISMKLLLFLLCFSSSHQSLAWLSNVPCQAAVPLYNDSVNADNDDDDNETNWDCFGVW